MLETLQTHLTTKTLARRGDFFSLIDSTNEEANAGPARAPKRAACLPPITSPAARGASGAGGNPQRARVFCFRCS